MYRTGKMPQINVNTQARENDNGEKPDSIRFDTFLAHKVVVALSPYLDPCVTAMEALMSVHAQLLHSVLGASVCPGPSMGLI